MVEDVFIGFRGPVAEGDVHAETGGKGPVDVGVGTFLAAVPLTAPFLPGRRVPVVEVVPGPAPELFALPLRYRSPPLTWIIGHLRLVGVIRELRHLGACASRTG